MDRLIAGERDPKTLAQLARTRARRKIPQLREALEGAEFFTAYHARLLSSILNRIDAITAALSIPGLPDRRYNSIREAGIAECLAGIPAPAIRIKPNSA